MDVLDRDFWMRYHAVDEDRRLETKQTFVLPCSDRFALTIVASPDGTTLWLRDQRAEHQLGWWDDVRWHPFALRWAELAELLERWETRPIAELPSPAPLLLLASFVGFGSDEADARARVQALVGEAYRSLGFSDDEIAALADHTVREVTEDDYRWTRDPELGWVFGGEYPCYSLRNREHLGGGEGQFPFAAFRELFD